MNTKIDYYFEKMFKWSVASMCKLDGDYPIVKGSLNTPECLISFKNCARYKWVDGYVHFFQHDYTFDGAHGIWYDTVRHLENLAKFKGILSPDFSVLCGSQRIPQMWNVYRNRLVQIHLERLGIDVIPTISWADIKSFDFCFKGIPKNTVVAVSTLGVMKNKVARSLFETGYREMCNIINPKKVLLYGSDKGLDLPDVPYKIYDINTYDWTKITNQKEEEVK